MSPQRDRRRNAGPNLPCEPRARGAEEGRSGWGGVVDPSADSAAFCRRVALRQKSAAEERVGTFRGGVGGVGGAWRTRSSAQRGGGGRRVPRARISRKACMGAHRERLSRHEKPFHESMKSSCTKVRDARPRVPCERGSDGTRARWACSEHARELAPRERSAPAGTLAVAVSHDAEGVECLARGLASRMAMRSLTMHGRVRRGSDAAAGHARAPASLSNRARACPARVRPARTVFLLVPTASSPLTRSSSSFSRARPDLVLRIVSSPCLADEVLGAAEPEGVVEGQLRVPAGGGGGVCEMIN